MKALMTNSLAVQYNWSGTRGKQNFEKLNLSPAICGMKTQHSWWQHNILFFNVFLSRIWILFLSGVWANWAYSCTCWYRAAEANLL